jgi:hypothetical protein
MSRGETQARPQPEGEGTVVGGATTPPEAKGLAGGEND